jgi:hypothetical protein
MPPPVLRGDDLDARSNEPLLSPNVTGPSSIRLDEFCRVAWRSGMLSILPVCLLYVAGMTAIICPKHKL